MKDKPQTDLFFDQYNEDQKVSAEYHSAIADRNIKEEVIDMKAYIRLSLTINGENFSFIGKTKLIAMKSALKHLKENP